MTDEGAPKVDPESLVQTEVVESYSSPELLYRAFEWEGGFSTKEKCLPQFENFLGVDGKGHNLGIEAEEVWQSLEDNFALADDWYNTFFPNGEMEYHNAQHARNTAAVAMKMFIARLSKIKEQSNGVGWEDPALTRRMVKTAAAVFALHEVDDWWARGVRDNDEVGQALLREKKAELRTKLAAQEIEIEDFEKLTALGDFSKPFEDVLKGQMESGGDMLAGVAENQREDVARAFGSALNAADFAQMCNPEYGKPIEVVVGDKTYKTMKGPAALAIEHSLYRNKALISAGWSVNPEIMKALDDKRDQADNLLVHARGERKEYIEKLKIKIGLQRVNWEKVIWGDWFVNKMAIPRIKLALDDLEYFDSAESGRLWDKVVDMQGKVIKN